MSSLVFEMKFPDGWQRLGRLRPGDPSGSLSHKAPDGRQVFVFGCRGDHSVIWRSKAGVDMEFAERMLRAVGSAELEEVARLTADSKPCEFWVQTDRMNEPRRVRFRHLP